jgi:hypothetical protein
MLPAQLFDGRLRSGLKPEFVNREVMQILSTLFPEEEPLVV